MQIKTLSLTNNKVLQDWLRFSPWLLAVGFVFWFSSFGLLGLTIDQEYALFRQDQHVWLSQGRWANFLISQYIYPQPVIMYFPQLMYLFGMVLSYVLILQALSIPFSQRWLALCAFPAFMAHPVWYFIAEFAANLIPTTAGMLAVALAVWLFAQQRSAIGQVLLLSFALGNYQSLIFVATVLYAAVLLLYFYQNRAESVKPFLKLILIMLASLVLNSLLLKLLYALYQTPPSYIHEHINLSFWLENPVKALESYFKNVLRFYSGSSKVYQSTLFASGLIFLIALPLLVKQINQAIPHKKILSYLLIISLLAIPFFPQILVPDNRVPYRTYLAVSTSLWLATFYLLLRLKQSRYAFLGLGLVLVLNIQVLHLHARYDSSKQLLFQHDQQVALQLYERIIQLIPDYNPNQPHPLSIQGAIDYEPVYGAVPTTLLNGSFFQWGNGDAHRISLFMRSQNYRGLVPVSPQTQAELSSVYAKMPLWPQQGSVQLYDNIILVKFSS